MNKISTLTIALVMVLGSLSVVGFATADSGEEQQPDGAMQLGSAVICDSADGNAIGFDGATGYATMSAWRPTFNDVVGVAPTTAWMMADVFPGCHMYMYDFGNIPWTADSTGTDTYDVITSVEMDYTQSSNSANYTTVVTAKIDGMNFATSGGSAVSGQFTLLPQPAVSSGLEITWTDLSIGTAQNTTLFTDADYASGTLNVVSYDIYRSSDADPNNAGAYTMIASRGPGVNTYTDAVGSVTDFYRIGITLPGFATDYVSPLLSEEGQAPPPPPPQAVSHSPLNHSTTASATENPTLTWDIDMQLGGTAEINNGTIGCTVTLSGTTDTVCTPTVALAADTTYYISWSGFESDQSVVQDVAEYYYVWRTAANPAPYVDAWISPINGNTYEVGANIQVRADITDDTDLNVGATTVSFDNGDPACQGTLMPTVDTSGGLPYEVTATWTHVAPQCHMDGANILTFTIHLEDDWGATNDESVTVSLSDTTAPAIAGPGDFGVPAGGDFYINGTVTDDNYGTVDGSLVVTLNYINTTGVADSQVVRIPADAMVFGLPGEPAPAGALPAVDYSFLIPGSDVTVPGTLTYVVTVTGIDVDGAYPAGVAPNDPTDANAGIVSAGAGASPPPTPHPFFGYVVEVVAGVPTGVTGADVTLEYYSGGMFYQFTMVTVDDFGGMPGYYQFDILFWNATDVAWVNATTITQGGYNTTVMQAHDNFLDAAGTYEMDDTDREFVNVTLLDACFVYLEVGWNLVSTQCIRGAPANALAPFMASDLVAGHAIDTGGDDSDITIAHWNGVDYDVYIGGGFSGPADDFQFSPNFAADHDWGFFVSATEASTNDDPDGIQIAGNFPMDVLAPGADRQITLNAGWNMVGWTSDWGLLAGTGFGTGVGPVASML